MGSYPIATRSSTKSKADDIQSSEQSERIIGEIREVAARETWMCNIPNKLKVVSKMLNEISSAIECKTTDMKKTVTGLKVVCTELLNVVCKLDDMVNKSASPTAGGSSSCKERNSESMSNFTEKVTNNIREKVKYKCNQCDKLFRTPTFKGDHIKVVT